MSDLFICKFYVVMSAGFMIYFSVYAFAGVTKVVLLSDDLFRVISQIIKYKTRNLSAIFY